MNIDDILPYKKWLLKAEEDFTLIKHEMFFEEKPTHNLEYLLELCKTVDEDFSQIDIANLTDYAISARYPVNFIKPSIIETNSSVDIAMKIREFILNKIK